MANLTWPRDFIATVSFILHRMENEADASWPRDPIYSFIHRESQGEHMADRNRPRVFMKEIHFHTFRNERKESGTFKARINLLF